MVLGRELEEQGAGSVLKPVRERPNHFLGRVVWVEKQVVGLPAPRAIPGMIAKAGQRAVFMRLDQKAESLRHLRGVVGELGRGHWPVIRPVNPDGPQERMLGIQRQPFARQLGLWGRAVIDQTFPPREGPGRSPEPNRFRQGGGQRPHVRQKGCGIDLLCSLVWNLGSRGRRE